MSGSSVPPGSTDQSDGVVYCVAAFVDLQGFSAHLEAGASDIRTSVGRSALTRLDGLEEARSLIASERAESALGYPETLHIERINDALILHLDLPDRLRPGIAETARTGYTGAELEKQFEMGKYLDDNDSTRFQTDVAATLDRDTHDLARFVGLLARLHQQVNLRERRDHFPGAKTVCATGYRRRFQTGNDSEDRLDANFAFANAQVAGTSLHGNALYLDDNVARLLCINRFSRNLYRFACFVSHNVPFDPTTDPTEGFYRTGAIELSKPEEVTLFRKPFYFRRLDPSPLTYLQILPELAPLLDDSKTLPRSIFSFVRKQLAVGPDVEMMQEGNLSAHLIFSLDLSFRLQEFLEIAEYGKPRSRRDSVEFGRHMP